MDKIPLTPGELTEALAFLSNKRHIPSPNAIKTLEQFLSVPQHTMKILKKSNEDPTKNFLMSTYSQKDFRHKSSAWLKVFQMFEQREGVLTNNGVEKIIKALNPYGMLHKGDVEVVMKALDVDGDGRVDIHDFERLKTRFNVKEQPKE